MQGKVKRHTKVIVSACAIFALGGVLISLQRLNAQSVPSPMGSTTMPGMGAPMMMGGMPGMMGGSSQSGGGSAESAPTEPKVKFNSLVRGAQTQNIKNWDGTITPMLRFKYKLSPSRVLTVHMPKSLMSQDRTKNGWEALFQSYDMTMEAKIDAAIKDNPPAVSTTGANRTATMPGMMSPMGGMMPGAMPGPVSPMPGAMPTLPGMPIR